MWKSESDFNPAFKMEPSEQNGPRPLYLFAKPSPELGQTIHRLPRADRRRPASLLHMSLRGFVDLSRLPVELAATPSEAVARIRDTMQGLEADAFYVSLDCIGERKCVTLRGSEPMLGVKAFQNALTRHLKECGFRFFGDAPNPHVTIRYRPDGLGFESIDPISWRVEEVLLIESVYGQAKHIEHGRWSLRV